MESCRWCGARLFGGAFCPRCFQPVAVSDEEQALAIGEIRAASQPWSPSPERDDRWSPAARHTAPAPAKRYSRWSAGSISFSGPVKVFLTLIAVVGVPFAFYIVSGPLAVGPILIWWLTIAPRAVRDLWRRVRVR